ncbi:aminotransferase class V-fold PLP-dependent enzyme [Chitinophaga sp. SYP-B3965]|uniref:cysteine desulfurase family protein n=1 Tax=Chitinophaga sp. SYP-B3965 TaxID=2663120 RepID=UPI001299F611|nr:cysteine desulfurase family protein [Chitinophaga sp. SYP-B3965]MRG45665.1 aminotransferase class V-fold PLP-dependent enzyme [Chitinophaga sp. SYP-B3965]
MIAEPLYLDHCATTPCDPRVVEDMLPYFTQHYGNTASRDHGFGWLAKEATELAREQVAHLIQANPKQIIFTSGATEAINLALKGLVEANASKGKHIITARTEHTAVLDTCAYLEEKGCSVTYLQTDPQGMISLEELEQAIGKETICIALMYANNETGVIHPVKEIGAIAKKYGISFMCDATQAVGKIPVNVSETHIDLMPFSAHKLYGPKGVGALYIRNNKNILQQLHGGAHERGNRSGTLNTPGIVGFGKAAEICSREMFIEELETLRDKMESELLEQLPGSSINGNSNRLPHVSNILFPGVDSEQLLLTVSQHLALSRGSACSGLVQQPSHVLLAMGLTEEDARNSIRISLGRFTTEKDIIFAVALLSEAVLRVVI